MTSTPFLPTPSWLDPDSEIKNTDYEPVYVALNDIDRSIVFILNCLRSILLSSTGIPNDKVIEVIGNSVVETGWGKYFRGRNLGGWKITKSDVERAKNNGGKCPLWWKALGHVKSGDSPVVYYRGFPSIGKFFVEWFERFVPRNASPAHRYYKTGRVFWGLETGDWFLELCLAGYKGDVTRAKPDGSVKTHREVVRIIKTKLCQYFLGVVPDGVWGNKSRAAAANFQTAASVTVTGLPDDATLTLLINRWVSNGMPVLLLL